MHWRYHSLAPSHFVCISLRMPLLDMMQETSYWIGIHGCGVYWGSFHQQFLSPKYKSWLNDALFLEFQFLRSILYMPALLFSCGTVVYMQNFTPKCTIYFIQNKTSQLLFLSILYNKWFLQICILSSKTISDIGPLWHLDNEFGARLLYLQWIDNGNR